MPDVFLFNNSALHDHVLGTKYRSLFSELLDRNVVQVVARSQEARDFQSMLRTVKDDTLSGVALPHAVAIQATADGAAERLGGVADRQKPGYLPSVGATSSGIALAQSLRDRCTTLERSNNPIDRRVVAVPRAEAASQAGRRAAERVARRLRRRRSTMRLDQRGFQPAAGPPSTSLSVGESRTTGFDSGPMMPTFCSAWSGAAIWSGPHPGTLTCSSTSPPPAAAGRQALGTAEGNVNRLVTGPPYTRNSSTSSIRTPVMRRS